MGAIVVLAGIAFMILVGRYLLPTHHPVRSGHNHNGAEATTFYGLPERMALIELPANSPLAGKTLVESRLGRVLGLNILGLQRYGRKRIIMNQPPSCTVATACWRWGV
ncbi:MAG: hypothetical protein HC804_05180 [Anaerolineae bacterium]|nr:hypothetical protein [Anaerolineae bacterium]